MNRLVIYRGLLFLNNAIAFIFFGLSLLWVQSPNEAKKKSNDEIGINVLMTYLIVVITFFSLISLLIGFLFRKKISYKKKYLSKLFFLQLVFFIIVVIIMFLLRGGL